MPCFDFNDTLRKLQNNEPWERNLLLNRLSHPNPADWEALGNAVASNTSLEGVILEGNFVGPAAVNEQHFELLCKGLRRNTSIRAVQFAGRETAPIVGSLSQCLATFLAKREVDLISFQGINFDPSSCTLIAGVLARCTFLRKISFGLCNFDGETSVQIIKSLEGMTSLESIRIVRCREWTGWDYLINHLRFSNHTLKTIEYEHVRDGISRELPQDLNTLLNMNHTDDKNALAIRKSLFFNFLVGKFDAKPYDDIEEEMKPKLLPHIMATVSGGENGDRRSEEDRLSALFHYVRNTARDVTTFVSD